jgi:hypothetical protein
MPSTTATRRCGARLSAQTPPDLPPISRDGFWTYSLPPCDPTSTDMPRRVPLLGACKHARHGSFQYTSAVDLLAGCTRRQRSQSSVGPIAQTARAATGRSARSRCRGSHRRSGAPRLSAAPRSRVEWQPPGTASAGGPEFESPTRLPRALRALAHDSVVTRGLPLSPRRAGAVAAR